MKKFTLSLAALMAMSTFVVAGGDIVPVEPVVETPVVVEDNSAFYLGLGYSYMEWDGDHELGTEEITGDALTVLAGYNFNKYLAVEGRYSVTVGDLDSNIAGDIDMDMSNIALYLKPMYPMGEITLYGLLGYGEVTLDATDEGWEKYSESGFQWGIGASYAFNDNVSLFVDYTSLYADEGFDGAHEGYDVEVDSINVGVTYKF